VSVARWSSALWSAGAWTLFGLGYTAALWLVATTFHGTPGRVLLVLAAGANLTRDLSGALGMGDWMRWTLDAARRLAWLEDYARDQRGSGDAPVPSRIVSGIEFDNVSFRYPATETWALRDVTLRLPAGSVVALVGENGAGKTTLVKLLCRFYEPSSGHIRVDGVDLRDLPASGWRSRLAGAFQDFVRFEFRARRTVGLGELALESVVPAVEAAVERAGATDVLERLPRGLETQLGATWTDGVDLSFGQWQKLALARGFMRERPLVLLLDEPTAALDAQTEHVIFERFAAQARSAAEDGRITVLVSHRFSTVRMADLIVVVDKGRVAEQGTHDDLVALGGVYADLYRIQASGYR
jgi:ATP-binding cassette, subfamily B, bacterial